VVLSPLKNVGKIDTGEKCQPEEEKEQKE